MKPSLQKIWNFARVANALEVGMEGLTALIGEAAALGEAGEIVSDQRSEGTGLRRGKWRKERFQM